MSLRTYLIAMGFGTILCIVSFAFIITFINPYDSGILGYALFYGSLFFALIGFLSIVLFLIRRRLTNNEIIYAHVGVSFRQAILISLIVIVNMVLRQVGELTLVKGAIVAVVVILIETFFHYVDK